MTQPEHRVSVNGAFISTSRLRLEPWSLDDAQAALAVYGTDEVAHWLAPAMRRVTDEAAMQEVLRRWGADCESLVAPTGRWKVVNSETGETVGGAALLPLPPDDIDCEIGVQLAPGYWGLGMASEAGHALAHYAFEAGTDEIFAVARPTNRRAASTARRMGMEWVGETGKYYDLRLDVYRLRKADLDIS